VANKGSFKGERGGCRERKTNCGWLLLLWRRCKAEQPTKVFVGKDEERRGNHFIRRTTRVLCQKHTPSILTGTAPAIIFLQHPWTRSQAAAAFVRRGGCANTADVRFSPTCSHPTMQCTVRSLGESHHESLAFPEQQIPGDNQTHLLNP
jgi:hypothetical protein